MHFHKHNVGVFLAIIAGLLAFGTALWPFGAPQTATEAGAIWLAVPFAAAIAFLAAAFLADRSTMVSRALLVLGGLILVGSGIYFGVLIAPPQARLASVIDIVPGILALLAAVLIGPMRTGPRHI